MPQHLGQHFLKNTAVITKIIAALDLRDNDRVIEIGPGKGALTLPLAKVCAEKNCSIVAIEKDAELAVRVQGLGLSERLNVVVGDALRLLPEVAKRYTLTAQRFKIVGNIPYYITGKLLRTISELETKPALTVLMIQKEVAERLTAKPGEMNLLAAAMQIWADISIIERLKPGDFEPMPKVDSAVIVMKSRNQEIKKSHELASYYELIHAAFKQPRKTLLNNLADGFGRPKDEILPILQKLQFNEKTRAGELSIDQLLQLSRVFA